MATRICTLLLFVSLALRSGAQDTTFTKEWKEIDSAWLANGLPKTALEKVKLIYTKAKQRRLQAQVLKTLIYRYTLEQTITENTAQQMASLFKQEIAAANDPAEKAMLYALLARQYKQYYDSHRWNLLGRSNTKNTGKADLATWSAADFADTIRASFLKALQYRDILKQKKIAAYDAVVVPGNARDLRPTLFDLVAHEALEYFTSIDAVSARSKEDFLLTDTRMLAPADVFLSARFTVKDSAAPKWLAIELFREAMLFHKNDADKSAYLTVDLERIEWVKENAVFRGKEQVYKNTLQQLIDRYPNENAIAHAWFLMASIESERASQYNPFGDTSTRYSYNKALELIEKAIPLFKDSTRGVAELKNLAAQIRRRELRTTTELVNLPGKPILASVSYRNVDTLYTRLYRVQPNDSVFAHDRYTEWNDMLARPHLRTFLQPLPRTNDHQQHTAAFPIASLPAGYYAMITSNSAAFNANNDQLGVQYFQVSAISYLRSQNELFVLHRETGQPMQDVKVLLISQRYLSKERRYLNDTTVITTDRNGHVNVPARQQVSAIAFIAGTDTLGAIDRTYFYQVTEPAITKERYEQQNRRMFFFTDRAIYRPGQPIYFKGIAVTRDYDTKRSKIVVKDDSYVYLNDVNGKHADSIRIQLNEYGSFTGQFKLPQNMLTGTFSIRTTDRFNYASTSFSVEEYKRPTFSVTIDKPKSSYRLNDSVTVTGTAKAFSGNAVDGAKVKYNITRHKRYLDPWFSRYAPRRNEDTQVQEGELLTDAQGRFNIHFPLYAADLSDTTGDPIFEFEIKADVTDIAGETRSAATSVATGFKSLLLQLTTAALSDKDSAKNIVVATTNLSQEKENATVHLQIYRLPKQRPLRERMLPRPDQFILDQPGFARLFPMDEYANESDISSLPNAEQVWETTVDTKSGGQVTLPKEQLRAGRYRVVATANDKDGRRVKQEAYITVFDRNDIASFPLQGGFYYTVKGTAAPGEEASFLSGIHASRVFLISRIERPESAKTKSAFEFNTVNGGIRTVRYTPDENDRGGVNITEAYVYNNRVYTKVYTVNVPWTNKKLNVSYASFRDHTEPGSRETWTVSVSGPAGEKVAAELLTGMYDASLDEFRQHNWQTPMVWTTNYVRANIDSYANFRTSTTEREEDNNEAVDVPMLQHDRLAVNAYELAGHYDRQVKSSAAPVAARRDTMAFDMSKASLNEVVNVGYGKNALLGKVAGVTVRGAASVQAPPNALYVVDGRPVQGNPNIDAGNILSIDILSAEQAVPLYGSVAANGAVIITTKNAAKAPEVTLRRNFNETAFFFPQLRADTAGNYRFSFTMPESLTKWKWMSIAHTKDLAFGSYSATIVTQKKLMAQANAPRFLREGDNMEFSGKIVNLSDKEITGQASLELVDPVTNTSVDGWFQNVFPLQYFTVAPGQSFAVKFPVQIPFSYNKPVTWRIKAVSGEMSDGEENILPVLSNRMLVTESLPIFLPNDTTRQFSFDKLRNNKSESLTTESITIEYSSNPTWNAVQALPYLMEYPYECAEQTFNRLYANLLGAYIVAKHPRIKQVFAQWQKDSTAMKSNLQKNEELKQVLLQETPWVMQAENEAQQKRNISQLFDLVRIGAQAEATLQKLQQMQLPEGGFAWFKGGRSDRYITNYIITGIGKLKRLGALSPEMAQSIRPLLINALRYLDERNAADYDQLVRSKADLSKQHIGGTQVSYLYMRSFFRDIAVNTPAAYNYYFQQGKSFWLTLSTYYRAQLGLVYLRNDEVDFASGKIYPSLLENTVSDSRLGMYWKNPYGDFWYQSPIEHQSMMIAFAAELNLNHPNASFTRQLNAMRTWLLLNKQTTHWRTTIATADACYALLLNGSDWLSQEKRVTIQLGQTLIDSDREKTEAGTGYLKKRIDGKMVTPAMGDIKVTVSTKNPGSGYDRSAAAPSWGSVYWQYFEDLDKITPAQTPLSLQKKLFIQRNTAKGQVLEPVQENQELKTGDRIVVRIELRSDRDMDYVHLKDMRAAAMEPVNVLSGYKWQDQIGYYESTRDASTNFFIDHLRKGTYVFEYPLYVTQIGVFSAGVATIQCMYAPEFTSHSEGIRIRVGN